MSWGAKVGSAYSPGIMAGTDAWSEVEAILRGCRDLCLRTMGTGEPPAPACNFLDTWHSHMDALTRACGRLPRDRAFGPVRNWVTFQEVRTILSGASAWPAELRGTLLACWAAVGKAVAPRVSLARIPAAPRGDLHEEAAPVAARPPDRAFLRQWTDAAVRKHKRILAEALAALRPVTTEEDGPRRAEAQVVEDLLARMDTDSLSVWPDDVGPQHPHPVWECITDTGGTRLYSSRSMPCPRTSTGAG